MKAFATIFRGATNLGQATNGMVVVNGQDQPENHSIAMSYLDSPNTTSATTYQVYIRSGSSGTINLNGNSSETVLGSLTCFEIKG